MSFGGYRPSTVRECRIYNALQNGCSIFEHVIPVKTEAGDENYECQQRHQPDESIPDESRIVDLFSIQKFRKQVTAQAHKERDAAAPFTDYRSRKKTGCVIEGD